MKIPTDARERVVLFQIHALRYQAHWGPNVDLARFPWPKSEGEWRQTPHGAPWDANVMMAIWHRDLAQKIVDQELVTL